VGAGEKGVSLQYYKRVKLGKRTSANISTHGFSVSYRTAVGSIGTRGFSIKTGIPGLTYRGNWAKSKNGLIIFLIYLIVMVGCLVIYNLSRLIVFLVVRLFLIIRSEILQLRSRH
jgi:hypothetical protein